MSSSKSHHRNSSSTSSDGLFDSYFSGLTEQDFKKIDEAIALAWKKEDVCFDVTESDSEFPSEIDGLNLNLLTEAEWAKLDDLPDIEDPFGDNEGPFDTSFVSTINLGTLTEEEFERSDTFNSGTYSSAAVELDNCRVSPTETMRKLPPLRQFRRNGVLSVTDLSNPTWCEVQYDYGLRGKQRRPIAQRPATFKSAAGKVISVEQKVAQKNDIRKVQGRVIHKKLEREIKTKVLEVKATTKETQWALRIVNMLACLKELLHGPRNMIREMPVFGILHDQVVVGVIDELECELSVYRKRKAKDETSKPRPKKRSSTSEWEDVVSDGSNDAISDCEEPKSRYTLHLRDAKTRQRPSIPDNKQSLAGRLQLQIYHTLLAKIITREPPFDFELLWKKLNVKPDAKLPKKFLVQAQLISDNNDLEQISLNDLVTSLHDLIKDQAMHVSHFLELVYYLRPAAKDPKDKTVEQDVTEKDFVLKAIPASSKRPPANNTRQPDMAQPATKELPRQDNVHKGGLPLIGRKKFVHDEEMMNTHISRVLEWWRGERPPEGVPLDLTSRCRTCEYANDCEWRAAKALELSGLATSPKTVALNA